MISLRTAIEGNKLDQFIAEHEGEIGDVDAFNLTVQAMAGMSKEAPAASPPDGSGD